MQIADRRALERVDLAVGREGAVPRCLQRAARRPDETERAAGGEGSQATGDAVVDADEVEHGVGSCSTGELAQPAASGVVDPSDRLVGAELAGELEPVLVLVDGDHARRREGTEELDGERAEPARPEHHGGRARGQMGNSARHRVVRRRPGVGERSGDDRVEVTDRDEGAHVVDHHVVGQPAVTPVAPTGQTVHAGAVQPAEAVAARAARGR